MAPAQYMAHSRHSAKVVCVIMLSVGSHMGSDTHKQHGQRGGDMRHFRMRIEPLNVAFQATSGVWSLPSPPSSLSIQRLQPHWLLMRPLNFGTFLRGLVHAVPHILAAWPLLTFSLNPYVSSSEMPSLVPTAFKGRIQGVCSGIYRFLEQLSVLWGWSKERRN